MNYEDLASIIQLPQRKLIVSLVDIDLTFSAHIDATNTIFVLMIKESRGSAGGRGGGSGMRKIEKILGFNVGQNSNRLIFETTDEVEIERFDIPYSAVAQDIVLKSGEKYVVQGVVDPQMVRDYLELIKNIS
ncbi:hypothetical protein [Candidatus Nitrosocosmicus hydrocola]|uniref:hypothetical protein n=1 Tax=Candidatus Nitrosocosmicus hydrocola TaxID=1826872 RepID=UPI0011E5C489|nr:hypothetical protein [Candidatus Nitrosocosmicus hydrocola]